MDTSALGGQRHQSPLELKSQVTVSHTAKAELALNHWAIFQALQPSS